MSISRAELREMLMEQRIPSYQQLLTGYGFKSSGGVVYTSNQCYMNSVFNGTHAFAGLGLHMVYGSLGLGTQQDPFFEFGGAHWSSIDDFLNSPATHTDRAGRTSLDAHVWLEDNAGRIYDYVTDQMHLVCQVRGLDPISGNLQVITAAQPATVRQAGLWHVAAPPAVQLRLEEILYDSWSLTYQLYMIHLYQRVLDIHQPTS